MLRFSFLLLQFKYFILLRHFYANDATSKKAFCKVALKASYNTCEFIFQDLFYCIGTICWLNFTRLHLVKLRARRKPQVCKENDPCQDYNSVNICWTIWVSVRSSEQWKLSTHTVMHSSENIPAITFGQTRWCGLFLWSLMQITSAGSYTHLQYFLGEFSHHICSHGLHYNQDFLEISENEIQS